MASALPTPRSSSQVIGSIIDAFRSRTGIQTLRKGSGILSALEASGQSDVRSAQDVFNALDLRDLERISGSLLDLVANDEGVPRQQASSATSYVNILDPRFDRISTRIYSGAAAINVGSLIVRVSDALAFPSTGRIFIGRGTINAEGPLTYVSKAQIGNYWTLTLSAPTSRYHNINEDVVLAQGGNRPVPSGTTVGTNADSRSESVDFATSQDVVLLDGEVAIENVPIVCRETGTIGNVPALSIRNMVTKPFPQAAVTNPLPVSNAIDTESDPDLRNRVRQARASRSKGTATAILFNTQGVYSAAENRRVLSANLVQPADEAATLYIDDGNGYEELTAGVPYEVLMDSASGGERDFTLSGPRPVAKAFVSTQLPAPFILAAGVKLAVIVGDTYYEHTFNTTDFVSIGSALAEEVVSSVNSDPDIGFSARTVAGATGVSLFAREETPDNLQVTSPLTGVDANTFLGFSTEPAYTLRLYKDDKLLYKDGLEAIIYTQSQSFWQPMTSPLTVRISVDGTPFVTYSITDADFQANTVYSSLSSTNSLDSWATVLNAVIPGITVAAETGRLSVKSNLGANGRASIEMADAGGPSSSVTTGMFLGTEFSSGQTKDYSLARNTGQIRLVRPLTSGQSLTAGSRSTRASVQSGLFANGTTTLTATTRLWVSVDGAATRRQVAFTAADSLDVTQPSTGLALYTCTSNANAFVGVQAGDWVILWDPTFLVQGCFRIVAATNSTFLINRVANGSAAGLQTGAVPTQGGLFIFTSTTTPQEVRITAGVGLTLQQIADQANDQLIGANVDVYRNKYLRIRTSLMNGDIALLTTDLNAAPLQFTAPAYATSTISHLASQLTANSEVSVPDMGVAGLLSGVDGFTMSVNSQTVDIGNLYLATCYANSSDSDRINFNNVFRRHFAIRAGTVPNTPVYFRAAPLVTVSSLVRLTNVVTVVTATPHGLLVGDLWTLNSLAADPDFAVGRKIVASVISTTSFTYAEAGADDTAVGSYYLLRFFDFFGSAAPETRTSFISAKPYHIGPEDNLVVVMDDNTNNLLFNVQMYRRLLPTSSTYGTSPISVVDVDNNNVPLATAFGQQGSTYFQDFYAYMRARTVSHANTANKSILWRSVAYGPGSNGWSVTYGNPTDESQGISHELQYLPIINTTGPVTTPFGITLKLPSGPRKTGINVLGATRWTSTVTPTTGGNLVAFTWSAPTIIIGAAVRTGGNLVTLTTATAHGFSIGDTVYVTSADANFVGGPKIVTNVAGLTLAYSESGANVANTIAFSIASVPGTGPSLTSGDVVAVGNVALIRNAVGQALNPVGAWRVTSVSASSFTVAVPTGTTPVAITTPVTAGGIDNLIFYPINTLLSTAALFCTYATANLSDIITGTALSGGAGAITASTNAEFMASIANNVSPSSVFAYTLSDGLNYVEQNDLVTLPNTITLKVAPANANIASADVGNEEIRLVPVLAESLRKWLTSEAVSGVGTVGTIETVSPEDYSVQLATDTIGDQGGVEIRSSSANDVAVPLVSTEGADRINIEAGATLGMVGGFYVRMENTLPTPKQVGVSAPPNGATTIQVAANGTVTFSHNIWSVTTDSTVDAVRVVQVGKYSVYLLDANASTTGAEVGGYFQIVSSAGLAVNKRLCRIQAFGGSAGALFVIVENEGGVDEVIGTVTSINFYTSTSVVPGDTLYIGYPVGSLSQNQGSFLVTDFGGGTTSVKVSNVFAAAGPEALGINSGSIRATEDGLAITARITAISPNVSAPDSLSTLYSSTGASSAFWQKFSSILGGTVTAMGKLSMPSTRAEGPNGYNSNVGLIGDVVKVLYGDPTATTSYPGVVAAGSVVNTAGPNVKRIQVSLQVRLRSGITQSTAVARIKTAVASAINRTPHGTSVALGKIVAAAQNVEGVSAVVLLSPSYTSASDVISVQANEKPKILDIDTDIRVTVVS